MVISLQSAIKAKLPLVVLEESRITLRPDCAVFITMNPGYAGRAALPMNLKALFRPVSMVVPDSTYITEILLYSSGFVGADQLAKKVVSVQTWASTMMKRPGISHDFGLRSIKSIVAIAETLKLQIYNIIDSELAEIIDENTLLGVPFKSDQIIKDIMAITQAQVSKQVAAALKPEEDVRRGSRGRKKRATLGADGGAPAVLDPEEPAPGLFDVADLSDDESDAPEDTDGKKPAKKGELYKQLWNRIKYKQRQIKTVYRQIGLDPDLAYEEEELEEYIILKAVRDFNHSKFAGQDHIVIEGVIKDVFANAVPNLDAPVQDYGNLQEALDQSFDNNKYDNSPVMRTKALQFYEIMNTKHGCIFVGEPQSGKTTLINLLESALNKAAMNEYQLTVQDKRRAALVKLAQENMDKFVEQQLARAGIEGKGKGNGEMVGHAAKAKSKKNERENYAKRVLAQFQELYKRTKLSQDELAEIRQGLKNKGVGVRRMNPKGMSIDELFGTFDVLSHEWQEGLFTQEFREFAGQHDDKKKWILLDGPIDFMWVENLNSILDDNRKMSLPSGEQIKMSKGMCILLETEHLRNTTPATVSRCGLIYLNRSETCDSKAIFNQWLRNLPPNLTEYQKEIEAAANFLMVEAIAVFKQDQAAGQLNWGRIDLHWLIQSFVRLLTTLMFDYYLEYEKSNAQSMGGSGAAKAGGTTLQNLTL